MSLSVAMRWSVVLAAGGVLVVLYGVVGYAWEPLLASGARDPCVDGLWNWVLVITWMVALVTLVAGIVVVVKRRWRRSRARKLATQDAPRADLVGAVFNATAGVWETPVEGGDAPVERLRHGWVLTLVGVALFFVVLPVGGAADKYHIGDDSCPTSRAALAVRLT